jgi:hypothetical protein
MVYYDLWTDNYEMSRRIIRSLIIEHHEIKKIIAQTKIEL